MFKRGDFVRFDIGGTRINAMVTLASSNGRSLMLMFSGAVPVGDGVAIGSLPVLQDDAGQWHEIIHGGAVTIAQRDEVVNAS